MYDNMHVGRRVPSRPGSFGPYASPTPGPTVSRIPGSASPPKSPRSNTNFKALRDVRKSYACSNHHPNPTAQYQQPPGPDQTQRNEYFPPPPGVTAPRWRIRRSSPRNCVVVSSCEAAYPSVCPTSTRHRKQRGICVRLADWVPAFHHFRAHPSQWTTRPREIRGAITQHRGRLWWTSAGVCHA